MLCKPIAVSMWLALIPAMPVPVSSQPPGIRFWDLPTGSHIAFLHYGAKAPVKRTPIIFLHGGPGAFIVDHPSVADGFYESLAALGFDVYLYDQIGSGHSAHLVDPRQYTVDRHIRDLEAIRKELGAERIILIGDSWGATLAANYIADYPNRCAKAIFSSPGLIDRGDMQDSTYEDAPMVEFAKAWFADIYSEPRYRSMRAMKDTDVLSIYRSVPEHEIDSDFDRFVHRSLPYLVFDPARLPKDEQTLSGMGWWVNMMTSADFERRRTGSVHALSQRQIPVLILRGGCDYVSWKVVTEYKEAFPNATLLYVPDAGHAFGYDQPGIYVSSVRAFLQDQPLPLPAYTSSSPPPRVTLRGATMSIH